MKIDISGLFQVPGAYREIDEQIDLCDVKRWGSPIFGLPVTAKGRVENRSGIVTISYAASFTIQAVCDRCLTDITRRNRMEFSHVLVLSLNREENDELIVVPDGQLDLAELCASDILLELPTAVICDEGCKGLCPICGKNRNVEDCGCEQKPVGRFDILRQLLEE